MKFDYNNLQNMDINKMMKYLIFLSFVIQWSFISMIINLFTMGIIRIPLFVLLIIDALTMIVIKDKTVKRPSFILSKLWDVIDYIRGHRGTGGYNAGGENFLVRGFNNISFHITNTSNKIKKFINNMHDNKVNHEKYNKERELNKFNSEIGKKITIEYTSQDNKIKKKTFEYKDRANTYLKMLESQGYKNYTKYNLNPKQSKTYIIFNKNKDIIDIENNKIQIKKENKDYKYVTDGWPKK